jgi:hypothetical protein
MISMYQAALVNRRIFSLTRRPSHTRRAGAATASTKRVHALLKKLLTREVKS